MGSLRIYRELRSMKNIGIELDKGAFGDIESLHIVHGKGSAREGNSNEDHHIVIQRQQAFTGRLVGFQGSNNVFLLFFTWQTETVGRFPPPRSSLTTSAKKP